MGSSCIKNSKDSYLPSMHINTRHKDCINKRLRQLIKKYKRRKSSRLSNIYRVRQPESIPRFIIRQGEDYWEIRFSNYRNQK